MVSPVNIFMVYQLIKRLTSPFEKWDAYETGVIDKDGNIIIPSRERNREQKKSFQMFDVMVLNMKKLLAKIPGGSSRFASYSAALFLLKEDVSENNLETNFKKYLAEDAPTNAIGSGNIAMPEKFLGARVFKASNNAVHRSRDKRRPHVRYSRIITENDKIREFCKKYPESPVFIQNESTGEMLILRKDI